ncbi:tetratricopeptide repeat protein [Candidatus Amoebophilus asiaticus]|nr:tetratricopeptide repeat protein [Candidatus Amoebophilus asiaticus]
MIKRPLLLSLIICFLFSVNNVQASEQTKIDSLKNIIETTKEDTTKIKALIILSHEYMYTQPDTAYLIAQEAYIEAEKGDFKKPMADAANSMAASFYFRGDYSNALKHWMNSLNLSEEQADPKGISSILGNIGIVYWNQGDYPRSLEYYFKALKITEELGYKSSAANTLGNIGIVYRAQGDFPRALEYYFKAMKLDEEMENKSSIARQFGNIGIVYKDQGDYPMTLKYYFKSLKINEDIGNKTGIAITLGNIGVVYYEQGDLSSEAKAKESYYNKALEYYFKALKMKEELGHKSEIAATLGNIGSLYLMTGRYTEAEAYLDSALTMSDRIGALSLQKDHHKMYSQLYDTLARSAFASQWSTKYYHLAYEHYREFSVAKDSLFNEEKSKEIGKLEAKHEFKVAEMERKKREEEQARLEAAAKARRDNLQYSGILIFIVLIFAGVLVLGRFNVNLRLIEALTFINFLLVFETVLVFLDPYIEGWITEYSGQAGGEPAYKLLINATLAGLIFPIHNFFEKLLKKRLFKDKLNIVTNRKRGRNLMLIMCLLGILGLNSGFDNKIDSLKAELKKDLADTTKVNVLNMLSRQYLFIDPDTAYVIATEALEIAQNKGLKIHIGNSHIYIGNTFWTKGEYSNALKHYLDALKIFEQTNEKRGIANANSGIGIIYCEQGDYPNALKYYFKALEMDEKLGNKAGISRHLSNIGIVYRGQSDYTEALKYYFQALKVNEKLGDKEAIATDLGNIGNAYADKGDFPKAMECYFKALRMDEELENKNGISRNLDRLAIISQQQNEFEKAQQFYLQSLKIAEQIGDKKHIAILHVNIGSLYKDLKKYPKAKRHLLKALEIAKEISTLSIEMKGEQALAILYYQTHNFKKAYTHLQASRIAKDSIFNDDKAKQIGRLEQKHEFEMTKLKRRQVEEEQARILAIKLERRNNLQYSGILLFVVFMFAGVLVLGRFAVPARLLEALTFISFLLVFETVLVFLDPYIEQWSGGEPAWKLIANAILAGVIFPAHGFWRRIVKKRVLKIEANK